MRHVGERNPLAGALGRWGIHLLMLGWWAFSAAFRAHGLEGPLWWRDRGVLMESVAANDYAPANLGQLKHLAAMAALELEATLEGGAGAEILDAIRRWETGRAQANDFAVANLGQVKAVATLFHQRLQRSGYVWVPWKLPWIQGPSNDFAPANLGQIKALFAFDIRADLDGDGLPDWWEFSKLAVFEGSGSGEPDYGQSIALFDGDSDPDGDGQSIAEERSAQTDPADFYNGRPPRLQVVAGDGQFQPTAGSEGVPFAIFVSDTEGRGLANAPVRFWVNDGDIFLAGDSYWADALPEVRSDAHGWVMVPVRFGPRGGTLHVSAVRAPGPKRANPETSEQVLIRYFGKPERVSEVETVEGAQGELLQLRVRYLDWERQFPLAGHWVAARVKKGDATLELEAEEGVFSIETDREGWVRIPVRKGNSWSEIEVDLGGWVDRFEVPPAQASAPLQVVGCSVPSGGRTFPADAIPMVWLDGPVPEGATDDEGRLKSKPGIGIDGLWVWLEVPISQSADGTVNLRLERRPVPGEWWVMPGRRAVAFRTERPLWHYHTWVPTNPFGVARWWQRQLRFQIDWDVERMPFALKDSFLTDFYLGPTELYSERARQTVDPAERLRMELDRTADTFVLENALGAVWSLPEADSEGVSAELPGIWIQMTQPISGKSVRESRVALAAEGRSIPCALEFDYRTLRLKIVPGEPLKWGTQYEVTGLDQMESLAGVPWSDAPRYRFQTASGAGETGESGRWNPGEPLSQVPKIVRPDACFVVQGIGDEWDWEALEAKLVAALDASCEIGLQMGVNGVTRRMVISPEERLESGVVYRLILRLRRKHDSEGSSELMAADAIRVAEFRLRAESPGLREALSGRSADFGSGAGQRPTRTDPEGALPSSGTPGEGEFQFPFLYRIALAHPNDGSPTSLEMTYQAPQGAELREVLDAPLEEIMQGGKPTKVGVNREALSPPLKFGTVIRMRAIGSGVGSGDYAPGVGFAPVPDQSALLKTFRPPIANFHYVNFERRDGNYPFGFRISQIDGMDPSYPKSSSWAVLERAGSRPVGQLCKEMIWCPVIVRDESDSLERGEEEFVLSTRLGDPRYAPRRSSGGAFELLETYKARLKKFYAQPYPKRSTAWISIFGDDSPGSDRAFFWDPAMPHLTATIREAPREVLGCWRLRVYYDRGNGRGMRMASDPFRLHERTQPEDFVDIPGRPVPEVFPADAPLGEAQRPKTGSAREAIWKGNVPWYTDWMPASAEWRIFESAEWKEEIRKRGFFGGEAVLYWVPKPAVSSTRTSEGTTHVGEMEVARFRIGGINPSNGVARSWLEGRNAYEEENVPGAGRTLDGAPGPIWFSYAIAKHETAEYRYAPPGSSKTAIRLYNQFRANPRFPDCGFPAWNDDGEKKPGGYGVFQVTGDVVNENSNIPRRIIWNWQDNMRAGGVILRSKWKGAVQSLEASKRIAQNRLIPPLTIRGVWFREDIQHTILDAMTMKRFNGASKPNPIDKIDWGENGSGYVQGFAVSEAEKGDFCYRSETRGLWCLCRFNGFVKIIENPDGSKKRIYMGFDYVDRVCAEIEPQHWQGGSVAGQ